MTKARDITMAARLATQLWRVRAAIWTAGRLRGDHAAQLRLRSGRLNPYPIYERLRAAGPLTRTASGEWATPSHELCNKVLRDRRFGVRPAEAPTPDLSAEAMDLSMLDRDPPDHTRLRRLAMPAFSPKMLSSYQPRIDKVVEGILDEAEHRGEFDLMTDFAAPFPIAVITELLGIPDADAAHFSQYGAVIGSALDGVQSVRHAGQLMAADRDLQRIFSRLIDERIAQPRDDVISHLAAAMGDDRLTPIELITMCRLLLIAGFETTVNLIGNGTLALLRHRDQWDELCADPELAPAVVEETLRYDPPVQGTGRFAHEAIDIAGQRIPRDGWVQVYLGAANRDPEIFTAPDQFDIHRANSSEHLAFSGGVHYCLGAPLARLEGAIAFRALSRRMPRLRQSGRLVRRRTVTIRGLRHFPVRA